MSDLPWRQRFLADHPDWVSFLDAVANDIALAAAQAGDAVAHEHLVGQAELDAGLALSGVEWLAAVHALDSIAIKEGQTPERSAEDEQEERDILQNLRDNEPLSEAFLHRLELLPFEAQVDVRRALEMATKLAPTPGYTRSILQRNEQRNAAEIQQVVLEFLRPIILEAARLESRFATAEPWELPKLMDEHAKLLEQLDVAEIQLAVETFSAETGDGKLLRVHDFLQSMRDRSQEQNHGG